MFVWLRSLFGRPAVLPAVTEERPAWVGDALAEVLEALQAHDRGDEVLEALQKNARAGAKQSLRLESTLSELAAAVTKLGSAGATAAASGVAREPAVRCDELFDALDALDEAQRLVSEPHLALGLSRVHERVLGFCERAGYTRVTSVGERPEPRLMRVVGTEAAPALEWGRITRVVRAAIVAGSELVREGEVVVSTEGEPDERRLGN